MESRIYLVIERPDDHRSVAEVFDEAVTPVMLDAAEDLHRMLTTGAGVLWETLYDVVALAFGTTRDDAKARILDACYGGGKEIVSTRLPEPSTSSERSP